MTQREEFEAWWEEFSSAHEDWRFADSDALRWATWQAAKQAQPEPSDLRGIDACPVAEWVDLVKRGYVSRDECLIAVKDIPLWIAKNSEQAQPERAPLSADAYEALVDDLGEWSLYVVEDTAHITLDTHIRRTLAVHGIKQGGQHD